MVLQIDERPVAIFFLQPLATEAITISAITKGAGIFTGRGQYGARVMEVQLTVICPKTLIVTLGDVLESGNAKIASI